MINILYKRQKWFIFIFIILIAFLQRGATLFVDFYDVDELTDFIMTNEIFLGGKVYEDAIPARPLYFAFFYLSFLLFGASYSGLHFATILLIIATAFGIYKINKLLFDEKAAYIAALLYSIFVSSFFEFYLAVHGEIILSLPVIISIYFFFLAQNKGNKYSYYFLAGIFSSIAFLTKGHALILFLYYPFYLIVLQYIFLKERNIKLIFKNIIYCSFIVIGFIFSFSSIVVVLYFLEMPYNYVINYIVGGLSYSFTGFAQIEIVSFIKTLFIQIGENTLAQLPLWLLLAFYINKQRELVLKNPKELFLIGLFIVSFMGIFLGGYRLYFHYFIQYLPILCLISGFALTLYITNTNASINAKRIKIANYILIIPIVLFNIWNYRNAFYLHYNTDKVFPINHSITPKRTYKDVSVWIKQNSTENDRIIQWGDAIEIYYFAKRRPAIRFLWCSAYGNMYKARNTKGVREELLFGRNELNYKKSLSKEDQWTFKNKEDIQYSVILDIDAKKPRYIIDTAKSNFRNFGTFHLSNFPILYDYIKKYYDIVNTIDNMEIYEIRN